MFLDVRPERSDVGVAAIRRQQQRLGLVAVDRGEHHAPTAVRQRGGVDPFGREDVVVSRVEVRCLGARVGEHDAELDAPVLDPRVEARHLLGQRTAGLRPDAVGGKHRASAASTLTAPLLVAKVSVRSVTLSDSSR